MNASKILVIFFLFSTSFAMFFSPRVFCQVHETEVVKIVDDYASQALLEELASKGIRNLKVLKNALGYFKALQKEFLVKEFEKATAEVKKEVIKDAKIYSLEAWQIKQGMRGNLKSFFEIMWKNIR